MPSKWILLQQFIQNIMAWQVEQFVMLHRFWKERIKRLFLIRMKQKRNAKINAIRIRRRKNIQLSLRGETKNKSHMIEEEILKNKKESQAYLAQQQKLYARAMHFLYQPQKTIQIRTSVVERNGQVFRKKM